MSGAKKIVSADSKNPFETLKNLWPYMWPTGRPDLKMRVVWATLYLVIAKFVLMLVPYFFKWSTDALNGKFDNIGWLPVFMLGALALIMAYNITRIVQLGLNQLRDALFASVGQYAVRQLAYKTFVHMHQLSLRFHLERKTGGLSRIIERGTKGIETIVRFTILNTLPTVLEFVLTAAIFWWGYGFSYLAVTALTVWAYIWFTVQGLRLAHLHPPRDERQRHGGQHQGDRFAAELRDGEIFRQRGDGSQALRPVDGALRGIGDRRLDLARLAELRPGRDLRHRHDRRCWSCPAWRCSAASRPSAISSSSTPC